MRFRPSLAGLILALVSFCASAQEVYRLEANDRIEVWTSVEPSLQRTATIGPDGWLSLPLVGHLKVAGMTALELEQTLKERLTGFFKQAIDLTVMLQPDEERAQAIYERTQAIYVTGEVATPGAYPFRSGMIVLHGISMAGGLQRRVGSASDEERIVEIRGEVARDTERLEALTAQIARITAEITGKERVVDGEKDSPFLLRERQILEARRSEEAILLKARDEARALGKQTTEALRKQHDTLKRRIEIAEHRLNSVSKLVSQGFANEAQQLELEGDIKELSGSQLELEVEILTAQREVSAEIARSDTSLQERRTSLEVERRDAESEREAIRSRLADHSRILQIFASGSSHAAGQPGRPLVSIIRTVDGRPVEFETTELSGVKPGDLIRVGYAPASATTNEVSTSSIDATASQGAMLQ